MNKTAIFLTVTTLVVASTGCGRFGDLGPSRETTAPPANLERTYLVKAGETLDQVAAANGLSVGEVFLANERLLFTRWQELQQQMRGSLEDALLMLTADERRAVAEALSKPAGKRLSDDHKALDWASKRTQFDFRRHPRFPGVQPNATLSLANTLEAGVVLILPSSNDAPSEVLSFAGQIKQPTVALVVDGLCGDGSKVRLLARHMAQGLRRSRSQPPHVELAGVALNVRLDERAYDAAFTPSRVDDVGDLRTAVQVAATTRPAAILVVADSPGQGWDEVDDLELWAKGLPPVHVYYTGSGDPSELKDIAKLSRGRFVGTE